MSAPDLDLTPGRWAVVKDSFPHSAEVFRIDASSERQIKNLYQESPPRHRIKLLSEVLATFATYPEARRLVDAIAGVCAELSRQVNAATDAATQAIERLVRDAR